MLSYTVYVLYTNINICLTLSQWALCSSFLYKNPISPIKKKVYTDKEISRGCSDGNIAVRKMLNKTIISTSDRLYNLRHLNGLSDQKQWQKSLTIVLSFSVPVVQGTSHYTLFPKYILLWILPCDCSTCR